MCLKRSIVHPTFDWEEQSPKEMDLWHRLSSKS